MRILLLAAITAAAALGQAPSPAKWTLEAPAKAPPGSTVTLKLKVAIDPPWHLYSPTTPPGPIPTSIQLAESAAVSGVKLY
ncbi:MAG TPA: redoxin, partial [Solibacterales bacterium]|nr:redoxin [Bryobacterales bacterium]